MFLQKNRLVQVLTRGRASFCTSDLGENEARGGSSNEVHCAGGVASVSMKPYVSDQKDAKKLTAEVSLIKHSSHLTIESS